jgi:peptide/nickel transport system ATP-binding protein
MMAILGLLPQTATVSGKAGFDGLDLLAAPASKLRQIRGREISFVFQEPMTSLNPAFTVGRQVGEVLRRHMGLSRQDARARTIELLDLVHIPAAARRVDEYPHQLSGGMRQRVMIAMAIACDPKILIADEPTTALDVTIQAGILDLMRELRERLETAIVLITHNLGVVADIADRVVVMYAGRKVEEAWVHELFARPQHQYTIGLLDAIPRAGGADANGRLREIPGRVPSLSRLPEECAFAPRCPLADGACLAAVPGLRLVEAGHVAACVHPGRAAA